MSGSAIIRRTGSFLAMAGAFLLCACGGDEADDRPSVPANAPPAITSPAALAAGENTASVARISATDSDGDALVYSIAGGDDAGSFTISASGDLSFRSFPDFELPTDADRDNAYKLRLAISDGKETTSQDVTVTVQNQTEGLTIRRIASGFTNPVSVETWAGGTLVAQRDGTIYSLENDGTYRQVPVPLPDFLPNSLLAIAVSSELTRFQDSLATIYVTTNGQLVVTQYQFSSVGSGYRSTTSTVLLAAADPSKLSIKASIPRGAGALFIAISSTSPDTENLPQDPSSLIGKVLRFNGSGNPQTVLASGLRDVAGLAFYLDQFTSNRLLIADRGASVDELNISSFQNPPPNFGWPYKDGTQAIQSNPPAGLFDPVFTRAKGGMAGRELAGAQLAGSTIVLAERGGSIQTIPAVTLSAALAASRTVPPTALLDRTADLRPSTGPIENIEFIKANQTAVYIMTGAGELYVLSGDAGAL